MRPSLAVVLACALVACSPQRLVAPLRYAAPVHAPDEPFRAEPPRIPPVAEVEDPVRETTLPSGLHVLLVERHGFPVVAATLLIDRGALDLDDPGGRAITEMTYLFGRGGNEETFARLSADSATTGVVRSAGSADDATWVAVRGPKGAFDASLEILARTAVGARLTPREYNRRAAEIEQASPWGRTSLFTVEKTVLFGRDQAYGYRPPGEVPISLERAQEIHDRLFQPTHATLVVVGDVTPAQVDESAKRWLGAWSAIRTLPRKTTSPPPLNGPRVVVVSRRERPDSFAAVFARGPDGQTDDVEVLELAARILGGAKSSALFEHLREGAAAVYAVNSPFFRDRTASWLAITASYERDKVVDAVRDVLRAIGDLREGRVTDGDVGLARETLLAEWRGAMSTTSGTAGCYATWIARGLEPSRMGEYPARLARVKREDVVRVAKVYLDPMAIHVAFIGDDRWLDVAPLGMGGPTSLELSK